MTVSQRCAGSSESCLLHTPDPPFAAAPLLRALVAEQSLVGRCLLLLFVPIPHLSYFCLFNGNQKGVTPNTGLGSSWDKACEDHGSMG